MYGGPAPLVVRVLPDVAGIDKRFDYLVPDVLADQIRVGTLVRISLAGRRVGGWVVEVGVTPPAGVQLRPIAKVTGWGPSAELVELAGWAAWRWAGRPRSLMMAASPAAVVAGLPRPAPRPAPQVVIEPLAVDAMARARVTGRAVVRLPPAADPLPVIVAAAALGDALVVTPSVAVARLLAARLRRSGVPVALVPRDWAQAAAGGALVIGARGAAWAPSPNLAAVVVIDEHDEGHQEERAPTWNARDVAVERARRAGVPCLLTSPCPSLEALAWGGLVTASRLDERAGWPLLEVVDRTRDDPSRTSLVSPTLSRHLRGDQRVVCVVNRKGRSALLACASCHDLARCERCAATVEQTDDGRLHCRRCGEIRPAVCLRCSGTRFRNVKPGTARLKVELAAAAGEPVVELTGETAGAAVPDARLVVGTEAALHQVSTADVVAFLDFDQELLAPRYRAAEEAMGLLARAARLVGGRDRGGRIVVQTSLPHHEVVDAVLHADPARLAAVELARRTELRFPPVTALAAISGPGAAVFADSLRASLAAGGLVEVLGPAEDRWLVRAPDHSVLADALAGVPRPHARLRVEVDPLRV